MDREPQPDQASITHTLDIGGRVLVRSFRVEVVDGPDRGKAIEAKEDSVTIGTAASNDLVLSDRTVSRFHLELVAQSTGIGLKDLGSRNGTWLGDVGLKTATVPANTELRLGRSRVRLFAGDKRAVAAHLTPWCGGLMGNDPHMRRIMATVRRVALTPVPVLVSGESGTGKELVARALHELSDRKDQPFVVVDCGALTSTLVASALFGHERGAFTGADRRHLGAFERANGGTVFLDEIGELPLDLQPQLLGVLERKRFLRLGGSSETEVDVRVVSATNRELRTEVNTGTFREDLYYRLAVVNIELPPLRERPSDLPLLLEHFLREAGSDAPFESVFPEAALQRLRQYPWPGNVRELRNHVEATVAMGESLLPAPVTLSATEDFNFPDSALDLRYTEARSLVLDAFERRYLTHLLQAAGGNVSLAARTARMDRSYLIKLLQKHELR
ncbi:MAG TPA: sigma 54-interacting transcriptional regulator [Polyangiaceae bacterium]